MELLTALEEAIGLAAKLHLGQRDLGGQPYILHPLTLMMQLTTLEAKIVAVLHDVVEDTPMTLNGLLTYGFPSSIVEAVDAITHRKREPYGDYIKRVKDNPIATEVKLKDIEHNSQLSRLPEALDEQDVKRLVKYQKACLYLLGEGKWE